MGGTGTDSGRTDDAASARLVTRSAMDEAYGRPEFYWGREPNDLCRRVCAALPSDLARGARAIDLGCGEGRDAVALARHGFDVVALDVSRPGLRKAQAWADAEGLPVSTRSASILSYRLAEPFRLVYSSGTCHHLPPELRAEVFANYKAFTEVGGVHAFNVFVEKPFIPRPPDYGPDEYFYRSGELLGHYWDWEVLHFEEEIFPCRSGGIPHRHAMDTLIARKAAF